MNYIPDVQELLWDVGSHRATVQGRFLALVLRGSGGGHLHVLCPCSCHVCGLKGRVVSRCDMSARTRPWGLRVYIAVAWGEACRGGCGVVVLSQFVSSSGSEGQARRPSGGKPWGLSTYHHGPCRKCNDVMRAVFRSFSPYGPVHGHKSPSHNSSVSASTLLESVQGTTIACSDHLLCTRCAAGACVAPDCFPNTSATCADLQRAWKDASKRLALRRLV